MASFVPADAGDSLPVTSYAVSFQPRRASSFPFLPFTVPFVPAGASDSLPLHVLRDIPHPRRGDEPSPFCVFHDAICLRWGGCSVFRPLSLMSPTIIPVTAVVVNAVVSAGDSLPLWVLCDVLHLCRCSEFVLVRLSRHP